MADSKNYQSKPYIYSSKGLSARFAPDRVPEGFYLDNTNCFERSEDSLSSRYGYQFVNRDPDGPTGQNYGFPAPVTSLARLLYLGNSWRYAGTSDGRLYRRAGDLQGPFTQIYSGLSGEPFQTLVTTCYETSQAFLFIYDQNASIKDTGEFSTPQVTGIDPPPYTANSLPFSPLLTLIDDFAQGNAYVTSGFDGAEPWTFASVTGIPTASGSLVTDFPQFLGISSSIARGNAYANNTLAIPPYSNNSTSWTELSFPNTAISYGQSVTVSIQGLEAVFSLTGTAAGTGTLQLQYSIDNGTTWTTFYSQSFSASQTAVIGAVSTTILGITNLDLLQYRIVTASYGTSGTGNVMMNATATGSTVVVSVTNALAEICDGMLSVLSTSGTNVAVPSTVYAQQGQTNLSFNTSQYEYNPSNVLRTKGIGYPILTDYIIATQFGFAIPGYATITGISVTLNWQGQHAGTGILTNVALYKNGVVYGTVKSPGTANQAYYSTVTLGNSTDLWGLASVPTADVNDSTFGFGVQVTTEEVGSTDRSFFASWEMTIYYSTSGGGGGSTTLSQVPIASIQSSDWDGEKYNTLTITTAVPHGISGSSAVSIYGSTNDLCDGFYTTQSVSATTCTVPYVSVAPLSGTGGTLNYYSGQIPSVAMLGNIYSTPYPPQFSAFGFYQQVPTGVTSFPIGAWSGKVDTNSTASVGVTANFDLSQSNQVNDSDLIALVLQVGSPANIASIKLQFDVNNSGYTSSYYTATISPAYYQGNIANQEAAYQSTQNQILADTLGILTGQQPQGSTSAQLSPSNFSTGSSAWTTVLIPRGNFLPVGNAGQSGLDWSNITGWQLVIETTATAITGDGSSTVGCNGLYLQWGYGPSSFAGVGYDWRYTYYNANTGTESNGSSEQFFDEQYGYLASLKAPYYFRQAAQVTGQYSTDPQVTHVRMYRRGGIYANNWLLSDQVPNLTTGGPFQYKEVVADASLAQASPLALDNDPPVTSTLPTPIATTLSAPTTGPGSSIYSTFAPQTVTVTDTAAQFYPNQTVLVGNANNLEEVLVVAGGTGQFSAVLRLQHNAGEQVSATSVPRQHPSICCLAYNNQVFVVDPLNPANVFASKPGYPESFSPAGYFPVAAPDDAVMALINWRGTLVAATQKTWKIIVGGANPYAQPTGAAHGLVSKTGWTLVEGAIWFQAADGWREFSGADGVYTTLPVEWMFRSSPETIVPKFNASEYAEVVMAYYQNQVYGSFISASDYQRYRLRFDTQYRRFGLDDVPATAMLWEQDINSLLLGVEFESASNSAPQYGVAQDWIGDFDDGGWNSFGTALLQNPIQLTIQSPYGDWGAPHNAKQWNVLEGDYDTKDQVIQTSLFFKGENNFSVALPDMNQGSGRSKYQFKITDSESASDPLAAGVEAYSVSIQHKMSVTKAPVLFQENIYGLVVAEERTSLDTFWQRFSIDQLKLIKDGYFDYNAGAQITVSLFADGSSVPYYVDDFTLIPQVNRSSVRVQFPTKKCRLWRAILSSTAPFQLWSPIEVEVKPLEDGSGYQKAPLPA